MNILNSIPRLGIYSIIIFTPLAMASVQGWAITVIHLITLIGVTAFLLEKSLSGDWTWAKTPLNKPFLPLMGLGLISSIYSVHRPISFRAIILLINYLSIFYLIIYSFNSRTHLRQLVYLIVGLGSFLAAFGIIKWMGINPFPWWNYQNVEYETYRVSSTFFNSDNFAAYIEMTLPVVLGIFLTGLREKKLVMLAGLTFVMFFALILSYSRGGWIASFFGMCFMGGVLLIKRHFSLKKLIPPLLGGILVILIVILSSTSVTKRLGTLAQKGNLPNFRGRVIVWSGIINMIQDHPLFGTGPGTFATIFTQYQPPGIAARYFKAHNDYLQFISEIGITLIPIMIWMMVAFYRKGFKKLKNPSRLVKGTSIGAMSGITAILIHSIADFPLHIPANAILFTILAAIVVGPLPKSDHKKVIDHT